MRRMLVLSLAVLALVGFVVPPAAFAQAPAAAPAPTFAITGFIDNVMTFGYNLTTYTGNIDRPASSNQWYGRTRGRFDIIGQVGPAKAVFGFEIDGYWGEVGHLDSVMGPNCITNQSGAVQCGPKLAGAESTFDINSDTQGSFQVKWLYTEFPMPLVPIPTIVRLGVQPFATAASYKLATYANGDFAGINLYSTFSPNFKLQLTYAQLDNDITGKGSAPFLPFTTVAGGLSGTGQQAKCISSTNTLVACQRQNSNYNYAIIISPEITPFKGLDVKPMYSFVSITGLTGGNAQSDGATRQQRGGIPTLTTLANQSPFAPSVAGIGGADAGGTGVHEYRHTVGVDARYRMGPWQLDPSVYYQWGTQGKWLIPGLNAGADAYGAGDCAAATAGAPSGGRGCLKTAHMSAWLVDVRGGFQLGPLLLQSMVMWTSGQSAKISPYRAINYYQPVDTDTSYMSDWGTQILSLGVDYYQILAVGPTNMGGAIGYDKYGRIGTGVKASYAVTPALTVGAGITPNWTDKKVDTNSILIAAGGLQPSFVCRKTLISCRPEGVSNYLGTEANLSLTYRFAPGLAFDWAIGYLVSGNALAHRWVQTPYVSQTAANNVGAPTPRDIGVDNVLITTARVRFSF